jgi:glutathione S-transferase
MATAPTSATAASPQEPPPPPPPPQQQQQQLPQLYCLKTSPWSERARFALDVAGVQCALVPYLPVLSQPALRWRVGVWNPATPVSVPVLIDGKTIIQVRCPAAAGPMLRLTRHDALPSSRPQGSHDIAVWAASRSDRLRLGDAAILTEVEAATDRVMNAGRARTFERTLQAPVPYDESQIPPLLRPLPAAVKGVIVRSIVRWLKYKYGSPLSHEQQLEEMRQGLLQLRAILQRSGGEFMNRDGFSYADIVAMGAMHFAAPIGLGDTPVNAQLRSEPQIAAEFPDLDDWRKRVYDTHRRRRVE